MKKLLLAAVMALGVMGASAQTKIGYINTDELMSVMPESAKVQAELDEYQNSLQQQGLALSKELETKSNQFNLDSAKLTPSMKEIRRNELIKLYTRLQNYEQEMQNELQKTAQAKVAPIRTKAMDAIKLVAKERAYTYVIDDASNTLLVMPPGDDLLPLVKAKLGIKDAPAPAAGGAKPAGN